MGRTPAWDDEDVELNALRGGFRRSRPARWKAVLVGLCLVGAATFVGGYYLPLHQAHAKLTAEHQRLRGKNSAAEQALKQVRTELTAVSAERDRLASERKQQESAKESERTRHDALKAELSSKLAKHVSKGQVAVTATDDGRLLVSLADALLFAGKAGELTPRGKQALCDLAKAAGQAELEVAVTESAEAAAAWTDAPLRAVSVAKTLAEACRVPGARVSATTHGAGSASAPAALQKQLPERVDIEVAVH